jgi:hypothetical protein
MSAPQVDGYRFGQMVVDGEAHTNDLILLPDCVVPDWWRDQGHRLSPSDLGVVFAAEPEVLVVGTGANGVMKVPRETERAVRDAGIELKVARTSRAWQLYNDLQGRRETAGAFHLTC